MKNDKSLFRSFSFFFLCWIIAASSGFSQTNPDSASNLNTITPTNVVTASFTTNEVLLQTGEIVTNVVRIENTTAKTIKFRLSLDFPSSWKTLNARDRYYEVESNDSLFIPVRIIPDKQVMGNTRVMISAYLISEDDIQLANNFFWAYSLKKTSWTVNIEPSSRNYFRNGSNTSSFKVNVLNTGSETQPINMTITNMGLYAVVTDSNGHIIKAPSYNFSLKPFEDTTYTFNFKYLRGVRNYNRVDIESHRPDNLTEERQYNLMVNTYEPHLGTSSAFQSSQKVSFIRLSDDKKVSEYESASLPLVVDLNVNNILNNVTFSTLTLRGMTQLGNNRSLIYNMQTSGSTNVYERAWDNTLYYMGYFYEKGSIQAGYINGGLMGIQSFGRGVKSDYYINRRNKVSAFYVNNEGLRGRVNKYAYGAGYELRYMKRNILVLEYGTSESAHIGIKQDAYGARTNINFLKTQNIGIQHSTSVVRSGDSTIDTRIGQFNSLNYTGNFLKNKIVTSQTIGHSTKDYANTNFERLYYTHASRYNFTDRVSVMVVNGYSELKNEQINTQSFSQNNQLSFNFIKKNSSVQPAVFYNRFDFPLVQYVSRGVGFSYNTFYPKEGTRVSTNMQVGYNKPETGIEKSDRLFLQWGGFLMYKTITLNSRYSMASINNIGQQTVAANNVTPQTFSSSLQHQYMFSGTHFILQTGVNYYYNNVFNQHSTSIFPELYYYTTNGWRFRVGFNYNVVKGDLISFANQTGSSDEAQTYTTQNSFVALGVRKEFGIPVPFVKKKNHDISFVAFYDLNGNGERERNESAMENIVISVGTEEVITNDQGEARMQNLPSGIHAFYARGLEVNESWFANIKDSLPVFKGRTVNVPFVRGVKIKGKVGIDRESIRADISQPFDLSRIKITANGKNAFSTLTDFEGNFELYLPYGTYTITMDESVLGSKYRLAKNNYEINSTKEADGMYLSFLIVEKKRKINRKVFTPQETEPAEQKPENRGNQLPQRRQQR